MKYGKELRCLNTKGKYSKVTDREIKWSIISKSVMIIIFVQFIDQLIDYPINCASLTRSSKAMIVVLLVRFVVMSHGCSVLDVLRVLAYQMP